MFGLVYGVGNVLPLTDTRRWGGLLLTLMLTLVAVIASFPIGVGLALGRRSDLPVIKFVSTVYIEVVRGVPLITVLFMAQLLLPLGQPGGWPSMPNVFRAMVAITLFNAAYLAENIRGGLAGDSTWAGRSGQGARPEQPANHAGHHAAPGACA